jgi:hypothetical protein
MATSKSTSRNTRNLNLESFSNIELFWTHIGLDLDMLGIARKLVKDVIQFW